MRIRLFYWQLILTVLFLTSCAGTGPFYSQKSFRLDQSAVLEDLVEERLIMIGDAGEPRKDGPDPVLSMAKNIIGQDTNAAVVFLGDNIYSYGMPAPDHPDRKESERKIDVQIEVAKQTELRTWFIPGNHDWQKGKDEGLQYNRRQEEYVDSLMGYNAYLPNDGCPGPVVREVGEHLALVFINTQWWLHNGERPEGDAGGCKHAQDEEMFLTQLEEEIKDLSRDRQVILAGHHPLVSNGSHGGYFTVKDHLFPLTELNKGLYLPMPVLGSIYPGYRRYVGSVQDLSHPRYRALVQGIASIMLEYPDVVYVAGHEHNLQYHSRGGRHHIVSGSGSKVVKVAGKRGADFAMAERGLCELLLLKNGDLWVRFKVPSKEHTEGKVVFERKLHEVPVITSTKDPIKNSPPTLRDGTKKISASQRYGAGKFKRWLMGGQYRDAWAATIEVPVLDLTTEHGGLTPGKRGGGMATKSLRYRSESGQEFVTRSVDKDLASILPFFLRRTVAMGIIQDGIAASHPYAAVTVPPMADALGIFHTKPKIVYLPDDPRLGSNRATFGNTLVLYEDRTSGDQSENPAMGSTDKLVSTTKVIKKLDHDRHNRVDQELLLRARLFDNVLGDWDRHDDQWRWASYEVEEGHLYKPIPRDRDQVFHKFEGFLPNIVNSSWGARNLRKFDYKVDDIIGQNFNARYLDRSFLTEMDRQNFIEQATYIQQHLTDSVIHHAIKQFPDTIYALDGEEIEAKLRSRRELLVEQAQDYYEVLAKQVDVVGSGIDELFEIVRVDDEHTSITIFPTYEMDGADRMDTLYHRIFLTKETKELCIYGIAGNDIFNLSGEVRKGPLVRLIGGTGITTVVAKDKVKGLRNKTRLYNASPKDLDRRLVMQKDRAVELRNRSDKGGGVSYDRKAFKYNQSMPLVDGGFNVDDGVFLGGGIMHTRHGFNKENFKSRYRISGKAAFLTGAWDFRFSGTNAEVLGKWDFHSDLTVQAPNFKFNFYGLGNESHREKGRSPNFYRFDLDQVYFFPSIQRRWNEVERFRVGPTYHYVDPTANRGRFSDSNVALTDNIFDVDHYWGLKAVYELLNTNNNAAPRRGVGIDTEVSYNRGLTDTEVEFLKTKAEVKFYTPLVFLPGGTVLGMRIGGEHNVGDFRVFQASALGGYEQLRGMRRDRFAGRSAAFMNTDVRFRLFSVGNKFIPFLLGGLAHFDFGRVWHEGEDSDVIHHSYGFGGWVSILDVAVLRATWSKSDDDELLVVGMGFFF